jgi:hypothetical protein
LTDGSYPSYNSTFIDGHLAANASDTVHFCAGKSALPGHGHEVTLCGSLMFAASEGRVLTTILFVVPFLNVLTMPVSSLSAI